MKSILRFLLGVILCAALLPSVSAQYTGQDCCDIAQNLLENQDEFDELDDRLDELADNLQFGLTMQQQVLMRVPFTEEDQQAWLDIGNVILNINDEIAELQERQNQIAILIMMLNQELSLCNSPNNGPTIPMPDPMFP